MQNPTASPLEATAGEADEKAGSARYKLELRENYVVIKGICFGVTVGSK